MAIKTHKVTLSLDNPRVIQSGINVQSFDKQSIQISIELTKNDEVFQVPSDATIRVSLLKLARQEQKIIVDVPNTNRDSIDWVVPDYLDGYQGTVRVGVYLVSGAENVDLGYFTILSNVSDIDKMADEFVDNVFQGWEQIEADLNELNLTIAQTESDLNDILTTADSAIANINAKNTQVNTLASDFTTDVATKQADVTSKYNAFDTSVTTANQTIDDILGLTDDVQQVSAQLADKALKTEVGTLASLLTTAKTSIVAAINELFNNKANKAQEAWQTATLVNGYVGVVKYRINNFNNLEIIGSITSPTVIGINTIQAFSLPMNYVPNWFTPNANYTDLRFKFSIATDVTEAGSARAALSGYNGSFFVTHGNNRNTFHLNISIPMRAV